MIAESVVPTLLEDWQTRRSQLGATDHEPADQTAALIKVLDYLIRRYEGTEAAQQPARTTSKQTMVLNTRAMIVHHHAWSGVFAGVKSPEQARKRMAGVLHRMEESSHRRVERIPKLGAPQEREDDVGDVRPFGMPRDLGRERTLDYAFRFGVGQCWAISHCLAVSPYLPKYAVRFLAARASRAFEYDLEEVALLAHCGSPYVYDLTARALGERIENFGADAITEELAAQLRTPDLQLLYFPESVKQARSRLRERLASEDPAERLRTINVLALIGDLHDISLLTDLATLCKGDEALAEEHAALVAAIDAISRRSVV